MAPGSARPLRSRSPPRRWSWRRWACSRRRPFANASSPMSIHKFPVAHANRFMFATGIENSYPVIQGRDGKTQRVDEMEKCGFYTHWKEDFHLVRELGLEYLRYGPQYYRVSTGPGKYDWSFCDETFEELKRLKITPIADLCHFGVPDWVGDFQNPDFPRIFAAYAKEFAERYSWVRLITPINEIYVCSDFSAANGWWNERLCSDQTFVTALKHMCKAAILAEEAILDVNRQAIFIQSEATCYFHAQNPEAVPRARYYNLRRFLSFDLCYGKHVE